MSQPDFSANPGKVWPFGLVPTIDALPSRALDPLDPRRQLYLSTFGPLLTAFQAAHIVAFGGTLTPAHYQAEAWLQLHEGADLCRERDGIAAAIKSDPWLAVRLYMRHRGLERPMIDAERSLQDWAEGGLLSVHGRRIVQGMTGLHRAGHSALTPVEFMSGQKLAIFGNRLGDGPTAITDLRFRMDDAPLARAMTLHAIRYPLPEDEAVIEGETQPETRRDRLSQVCFALDPSNMRAASIGLEGQPLSLRAVARNLADLYLAAGHTTTAKSLADNMRSTLKNNGYPNAAAIAKAIGWTGEVAQ